MPEYHKKIIPLALFLVAICAVVFNGCGRMPPEEFWTWTKDDSIQIQEIVNQWKPIFRTVFEDTFYPINYISDTVAKNIRKSVSSLWVKQHFWPRRFYRTVDSYMMIDSFIPVKDTTVTVKIVESLFGRILVYAESSTVRLGETVIGNNSYPLYSRRFVKVGAPYTFLANNVTVSGVNNDSFYENSYQGYSVRFLHFERDTVGNWYLSKMSGGARLFIPSEADAPYLSSCSLRTSAKALRILARPDTTQYGIQRLYPVDSILSFRPNDTLRIRVSSYDPFLVLGFVHYNRKRYDLTLTTATTSPTTTLQEPLLATPTWQHLMLELAPWEALIFRGNYNALVWQIPMQIKP
ncbi:MAG: hypothetical protein N2166_00630 [candidate division WOR-3 bacterium]|nr:hypothetical protein [candidate division WOR-3 bacterium]